MHLSRMGRYFKSKQPDPDAEISQLLKYDICIRDACRLPDVVRTQLYVLAQQEIDQPYLDPLKQADLRPG